MTQDPLPVAQDALDCGGALPREDVVFLARALFEAHEKVDQLYAALERRSDATRSIVDQILCDTAGWTPAASALRAKLRAALDRGVVYAKDQVQDLDKRRLDWLAASADRLLDARGLMVDASAGESVSLREAIDRLMQPEVA